MALADSLREFYENAEEKYYSFLDWVDEKGVPVYKVVDAIEARNIPSFPIAIVLSLIVLMLVVWGITGMLAGGAALEVNVTDASGNAVAGAAITAYANGELADEGTTSSDGSTQISVPLNTELEINVIKQGYGEKTSYYTAKSAGESTTITVLEEIDTLYKTISLMSAGTSRLIDEEVEVEFYCTGSSYSETKTTSSGKINLDVPSDCDTLIARSYGNYKVTDEAIYLSSADSFELYLEESEQAMGSAIVTISNNKGETLAGIDVSLYTVSSSGGAGSAIQTKQTTTSGSAVFNSVPAGNYYVVAFDRGGTYSEYDGLSQGVTQEIKEEQISTFSAVMSDSVVGKIRVVVKDKDTGDAISNASVSLSKNATQITELYTNAEGKAEFSVGEDIDYSVAVDKAGYLIAAVSLRPSADYAIIEIEQATVENSQSLLVKVLDSAGKPVENVRLKLKKNYDGTQVGGEIVTGLDGRGVFERIEDGDYYVYALKPGYGEKTSETISVSSREENTLTMKLAIGSGTIAVSVADDQGNTVTGATVKAVDASTKGILEEEVTGADGKTSFSVRADKRVYLLVSSDEHMNFTTAPIELAKDVTSEKSVVLAKTVSAFGIELDGLYANGEKVSETSRALGAGQAYTAKFRLLIPKNASFEEAGVHVRTGAEGNNEMEKDGLYLTEIRAAYDSLQQGMSYTPPTGQATDFQHLTSGNSKWANIVFEDAVGGVYEIEADIQVKAEAKIGSLLDISYRAFGKSGGYLRAPSDAVLGTSPSRAEKEGLYANALKRSYSVGPTSLCGEEFCSGYSMTDLLGGITTSVIDDYAGQSGNRYRLSFALSSVSETPFGTSQLSLKDKSSSISIDSYKITTALGETREGSGVGSELSVAIGDLKKDSVVSGEIVFEAKKDGSIPLELSIVSGSGTSLEVYSKTIHFNSEPASEMEIDILPKVIVPFINNNLLVRVSDDNATLSNAFVSIKKDGTIVASGETNSDGIFAYTLLSPADGSTIGVLVEKAGFKATEKELKVTSNVLLTEPETVKLSMTIGGTDFKTIDAYLQNYSQIPLNIDSVSASRDFEDFAAISFTSPLEGDIIANDANAVLEATVRLGPKGMLISQPLKIAGSVDVEVSNSSFQKTWLASLPFELTIGFGDEVDDTECFNIYPSEWDIYGSTGDTQTLNIAVSNSCTVGGQEVSLRNISARVVTGNDNELGAFTVNGKAISNTSREIQEIMEGGAEENFALQFKPSNVISAAGEAKIEIQATHLTSAGEQELTRVIDTTINVNNLAECVEILSSQEIVVESCAYNLGYSNYGGMFSQYTNSRYSSYDPYSTQYGYGTGNPSYIGSDYAQNSIYGDSYYDYQNSYYPNNYYSSPYMNSGMYGNTGYGSTYSSQWGCGQGGFAVRNNCASPVDISFNAQAGISVGERTTTIEPGEEEEITIEPTNFFGRYALKVGAKTSESNEKATDIATLYVNVSNEYTKNYKDCISVSPSRTLNFNNFFGKPVELKVINSCFADGVFLQFSNSTIAFSGTGVSTPTDAGAGFTEMIESHAIIDEEYVTSSDGRVSQVLTFELVKALKEYRNKAPEAKFFEENDFANIGNLRYFVSSGYYSVMGNTNMRVNFTTPSGGMRTISFPMVIKDYWNLLDYADSLSSAVSTHGDSKAQPCQCLNAAALDFSKLGELSPETSYSTSENGILFKIAEQNGCGSSDYLHSVTPQTFTDPKTGLKMIVGMDSKDSRHEVSVMFDTSNWNGQKTQFNSSATGKVTRVSPAQTQICALPVRINIAGTGETTDKPGQPTGTETPGTPTSLTFDCGDGKGQTGADVFQKYGLQHIHYAWDETASKELGVKEDACDAEETAGSGSAADMKDKALLKSYDEAPWFCDAVQTSIELERKNTEIEKVIKEVEGSNDGKGLCTDLEGAERFDCAAGKNSMELYRYVLSQKAGYFLGSDGKVLRILDNIDTGEEGFKELKELVDAVGQSTSATDNAHNAKIITDTLAVMNPLLEKLNATDNKGMDVVLELNDWEGELSEISGALKLGDKHYAVPLKAFRDFDTEIQKCLKENPAATSCTINGKAITVAFLQKLYAGEWAITAKNANEMGEPVKKLLMQKGNWELGKQSDYQNFWVFYKANINPGVYLMKDTYSADFAAKYAKANAFEFEDGALSEAGRYSIEIRNYWGNEDKTKAKFVKELGLAEIDEKKNEKKSSYAQNILFSTPIDGTADWGTAFTGNKTSMLYFNYENEQNNYQAKTKGSKSLALSYKADYADTKRGIVTTITGSNYTLSLSEPVEVEAKFTRKANSNAGFLYQLNKVGNDQGLLEMLWKVQSSSLGSIEQGKTLSAGNININDLCKEKAAGGSTSYPGFVAAKDYGDAQLRSVIFVPSASADAGQYSFRIVCSAENGTAALTYLGDISGSEKPLGTISDSGPINLTNAINKVAHYKDGLNLTDLLGRINKEQICITSTASEMKLVWNDQKFWEG